MTFYNNYYIPVDSYSTLAEVYSNTYSPEHSFPH